MAVLIPVGDRWLTADQLRRSRQWREAARRACPPGSICYLCGKPVVHGLRPNHPLGPSVDHIVPLELGGHPFDPANLAPCHFGENSAKGARVHRPDTDLDM